MDVAARWDGGRVSHQPRALDAIPPVWLVLGGISSLQVGAAIAKGIFDELPPTALVWIRLLTPAVILLLAIRPTLQGRSRQDWWVALGFGMVLMSMNWTIYQAFARIPIGIAVTIEFLGPLTVAVLGSRRWQHLIWVVLAGMGVALLGFSPTSLDPVGVAYALLAGVLWGGYILLSARTGRHWTGVSGLAIACTLGAVLLAGPSIVLAGSALLDPRLLGLALAIGLLSSVIPYSLELVALRRIPSAVFGILMSLEPAVAALAGMIFLSEFLSWPQWLALGCVVAASVGAIRTGGEPGRLEEPVT